MHPPICGDALFLFVSYSYSNYRGTGPGTALVPGYTPESVLSAATHSHSSPPLPPPPPPPAANPPFVLAPHPPLTSEAATGRPSRLTGRESEGV